jgi:hypothetical protein
MVHSPIQKFCDKNSDRSGGLRQRETPAATDCGQNGIYDNSKAWLPLSIFKAMPQTNKAETKNAANSFENCLPRSGFGRFHPQLDCKG